MCLGSIVERRSRNCGPQTAKSEKRVCRPATLPPYSRSQCPIPVLWSQRCPETAHKPRWVRSGAAGRAGEARIRGLGSLDLSTLVAVSSPFWASSLTRLVANNQCLRLLLKSGLNGHGGLALACLLGRAFLIDRCAWIEATQASRRERALVVRSLGPKRSCVS